MMGEEKLDKLIDRVDKEAKERIAGKLIKRMLSVELAQNNRKSDLSRLIQAIFVQSLPSCPEKDDFLQSIDVESLVGNLRLIEMGKLLELYTKQQVDKNPTFDKII